MSMILLTSVGIVDNLAEKIDECPLNQGGTVLFVYSWECKLITYYMEYRKRRNIGDTFNLAAWR